MTANDPTVEPGGEQVASLPAVAKGRKAFLSARRSLTEKELSSPAVSMMLIEDIERLEEEKAALAEFRDTFYALDKKYAVLRSKTDENLGNEIIFGVALSLGFGAIGYAPSVWEGGSAGKVILAIGVLIVIVGVAAKFVSARSALKGQAE